MLIDNVPFVVGVVAMFAVYGVILLWAWSRAH